MRRVGHDRQMIGAISARLQPIQVGCIPADVHRDTSGGRRSCIPCGGASASIGATLSAGCERRPDQAKLNWPISSQIQSHTAVLRWSVAAFFTSNLPGPACGRSGGARAGVHRSGGAPRRRSGVRFLADCTLATTWGTPGQAPGRFCSVLDQAISVNAARAAARVASITASSCCADTKPASKADGARYTPASSMAWKNRLKRAVSQAITSA